MKIVITVAVIFLLTRYWGSIESFLSLFFVGAFAIVAALIISYVLNIPMRFFERMLPGPMGDGTRNRVWAVILSAACAIVIALFIIVVVIPNLIEAIVTLVQRAPAFVQSITKNEAISSLIPTQLREGLESIDWNKTMGELASWLQSGIMSSLPQVITFFGLIGACFIGTILSFWFIGEKNKLSSNVHMMIRTYVGKRADDNFRRVIRYGDESFRSYIVAQSLEGLLFGTLVAVICAIAGIPGAPVLGALVGVMSLIPMVGAWIGAFLGAVIILATSWQKALIFLVVFFIALQIEQNFLYPRIVTKQVGLWGMWPLVGSVVGVAAFGFPGAFVGVPLLAAVFRIVRDDLKRRKELPEDALSPFEEFQKRLND